MLFNNNSAGDAAVNAKEFQAMLGIEYEGQDYFNIKEWFGLNTKGTLKLP